MTPPAPETEPPRDAIDLLAAAGACATWGVAVARAGSNPDLFWHLSSAARALETRSIVRADWLSSTRHGAPWTAMEWLTELIWYGLHTVGGYGALWAFKGTLLLLSAGTLHAVLALQGAPRAWRFIALGLVGAAVVPAADLRPDNTSLALFSLTLLGLERWRSGRVVPSPGWALPFVALWANLHPGFFYAFALLGAWTAGALAPHPLLREHALPQPSWRIPAAALALGVAGSFVHPVPIGQWVASFEVRRQLPEVSRQIAEWMPPDLSTIAAAPFTVLLLAFLGAAAVRALRRLPVAAGPLLATAFVLQNALAHNRFMVFAALLMAPLALRWLRDGLHTVSRIFVVPIAAVLVGWSVHVGSVLPLGPRWDFTLLPVRATDFLARERETLGRKVMFNPWGWGGYLGWRLHPPYLIFQDGRYLFHDLIGPMQRAAHSPTRFAAALDAWRVDVLLMQSQRPGVDLRLRGTAGEISLRAPYWVLFAPRERWALVHADDTALVFVRRTAVPAEWIRTRSLAGPYPGLPAASWRLLGYPIP